LPALQKKRRNNAAERAHGHETFYVRVINRKCKKAAAERMQHQQQRSRLYIWCMHACARERENTFRGAPIAMNCDFGGFV
jgi:hypothetical protein